MESEISRFFDGIPLLDKNDANGWDHGDLTTEQAEALRSYMAGHVDAQQTAARLSELASEMQTHDNVESFMCAVSNWAESAAEELVDAQPRIIELLRALLDLPPVRNPETKKTGEPGFEDLGWSGRCGLNAFRVGMTDKVYDTPPSHDRARALYAFVARLQASGEDELRNWSFYAHHCIAWIAAVLEPRAQQEQPRLVGGDDSSPTPAAPATPSAGAVSAVSQLFIYGLAPMALNLCHSRHRLRADEPGSELSVQRWQVWLGRLEELSEGAGSLRDDQARADAKDAVDAMRQAASDLAEGRLAGNHSIPKGTVMTNALIQGRPVES